MALRPPSLAVPPAPAVQGALVSPPSAGIVEEASAPVAHDAFVKSPEAAPDPAPPSAIASFRPIARGADDLPVTVRELPVSKPAATPPEDFYSVPPDAERITFGRDPGPTHERRPAVAIAGAADLHIAREEFLLMRKGAQWSIKHRNPSTRLVVFDLRTKEELEFRPERPLKIDPGRYTVQVVGRRMAASSTTQPIPPGAARSDWLVDDVRDKMLLPRVLFLEIPEVPASLASTGEQAPDEAVPTIRTAADPPDKASPEEETTEWIVRLMTRAMIAEGEADPAALARAAQWKVSPTDTILETIEGLVRYGGLSINGRTKEDEDRCHKALRAQVEELRLLAGSGTASSQDLERAVLLFQRYGEPELAAACGVTESECEWEELDRRRADSKLEALRWCDDCHLHVRFDMIVFSSADDMILSAMKVLAERGASLALATAGIERLAELIDATSSGDALALALSVLKGPVFADVAQAVVRRRRLSNLPLRAPSDAAQLAALQSSLEGHVQVTMGWLLLRLKRLRGCLSEDAPAIEQEIERHVERAAALLRVAEWLGFAVEEQKAFLAAVVAGARASYRSARGGPVELEIIRKFYGVDVSGSRWDATKLAELRRITDEIFERHLQPDVMAELGDDGPSAYDIYRGQASLLPGNAQGEKRSIELPAAKEGFLRYDERSTWYVPKGLPIDARKDEGRFYITLAPEGYAGKVGAVVDALQDIVRDVGEGVFFKVSGSSGADGAATKRDQIVIYFTAEEGERLLAALEVLMDCLAMQDPELFSGKGPALTRKLRDGLFFGQSPLSAENGESFGSVRAEALTRMVREIAWLMEKGAEVEPEFRVSIFATFLQEAGVDPTRPAFNRGGAAKFPYIP